MILLLHNNSCYIAERREIINEYEKIISSIIDLVLNGELRPGDRLPSEKDLARKYNVSTMTVRKSIEKLQSMNVLESIERKGSFVRKLEGFENSIDTFVRSYTLSAKIRNLESNTVYVSHEKTVLELDELNQTYEVYKIIRHRYLNEVISAIEYSYVPIDVLGEIKSDDNFKSIYGLIFSRVGENISKSKINLCAINANKELTKQLQLDEDEGVLVIKQISLTSSGRFVEYSETYQAGKNINI